MPNVATIFDGDSAKFRAEVDAAGNSVSKAADAIASAKNKILESFNAQVKAAQENGASAEKLASIQTKAANQMANVTEANANKMIASLDRISARQKAVASELGNLKVPEVKETNDITNRQRASALLRGGGLRAAENFASQFNGFNKVAEIAFPILGATTFAAELVKMGVDGYEAFKKLQDSVKNTGYAFDELHDKSQTRIDDLAIENQHIQDQIDKLSGHPNNGLADALLSAKKRADELVMSVAAANKELQQLFRENDQTTGAFGHIAAAFGFGDATTNVQQKQIAGDFHNLQTQAGSARDKYNKDFGAATDDAGRKAATDAYNQTIAQGNARLAASYAAEIKRLTPSDAQVASMKAIGLDPNVNGQKIENLQGALSVLGDMSTTQTLDSSIYDKQQTLGGLKQGKEVGAEDNKAAEQRLKSMEAYVATWKTQAPVGAKAIYDYWDAQRNSFAVGSSEYNSIVEKQASIAEEGARKAHEAFTKLAETMKDKLELPRLDGNVMGNNAASGRSLTDEYNKSALAQVQLTAEYDKAKVAIDLSTGAISKLTADQRLAAIAAQEHAARIADLKQQLADLQKNSGSYNSVTGLFANNAEQKQAVQINAQINKETSAATIDAMKSTATVAGDTWSGALKNANAQWIQNSQDSAAQVVAIYHQALNGLNDQLSNLITGKKADFAGMFQGLSKSIATAGLQQVEGAVMGKLGLGKPDGSASNPFHVTFASSAIGGALSGAVGGATSKVGGFFASLFGGGKAVGGGVSSGTTYLVGEAGPELFSPKTSGTIVPNNALGSAPVTYSVQVANGVTPEQMKMHVQEALRQYHPQAVAASVAAVRDSQQRRPTSTR